MKRYLAAIGGCLLFAGTPSAQEPEGAPSPNAIVEAAAAEEWVTIAPDDLLVMDLAADRDGNARRVVIQLMPPPFSQGWVENIRTLARAGWYDGVSVNRVQDNYVVQWGDATEEKPLPEVLNHIGEDGYEADILWKIEMALQTQLARVNGRIGDAFLAPLSRNETIAGSF